jgi:sulfur-carrier protein
MMTKVLIPQVLTRYAAGHSELLVPGNSVQEVLTAMQRDHQQVYQCVCDETGALRRHINIFVNNDFLHDRSGLQTELVEGDVISIFQAVSGG